MCFSLHQLISFHYSMHKNINLPLTK